MDLKIWTTLALGLVLLAGPALAQGDPPPTTLLLPHRLSAPTPLSRTDPLAGSPQLFDDDPLANVDALTGEGSLSNPRPARGQAAGAAKPGQGSAGCDRRAGVDQRRARSGVAFGGSGPGEYARFLDNGQKADGTSAASASSGEASSAAPRSASPPSWLAGDRPLYGGVDRPLWSDPRPPAGRQPPATARRARDPEAPSAAASTADRPLWAEPDASSRSATPCDGAASTRRAATPPTTLFFGTGPAR